MIPDLYRLGYATSAFVVLTVDLERLQDIATTLASFPDTTLVAETMGRYDLMLFVAAPSVQELSRFVSEKIATIPGVRNTETFVTPAIFKVLSDWRLPVKAADECE